MKIMSNMTLTLSTCRLLPAGPPQSFPCVTSGQLTSEIPRPRSELDHNSQVDKGFVFAEIWEPHAAGSATARGFRRPEARLPRRGTVAAGEKLRRTVVSSGRRNAACATPIGHAGVAIVILRAECDVLLRHIVKGDGRIPRFKGIARIPCKIRRIRGCRDGSLTIDRWNQHQIA